MASYGKSAEQKMSLLLLALATNLLQVRETPTLNGHISGTTWCRMTKFCTVLKLYLNSFQLKFQTNRVKIGRSSGDGVDGRDRSYYIFN